jgi:hypothetical protein
VSRHTPIRLQAAPRRRQHDVCAQLIAPVSNRGPDWSEDAAGWPGARRRAPLTRVALERTIDLDKRSVEDVRQQPESGQLMARQQTTGSRNQHQSTAARGLDEGSHDRRVEATGAEHCRAASTAESVLDGRL